MFHEYDFYENGEIELYWCCNGCVTFLFGEKMNEMDEEIMHMDISKLIFNTVIVLS